MVGLLQGARRSGRRTSEPHVPQVRLPALPLARKFLRRHTDSPLRPQGRADVLQRGALNGQLRVARGQAIRDGSEFVVHVNVNRLGATIHKRQRQADLTDLTRCSHGLRQIRYWAPPNSLMLLRSNRQIHSTHLWGANRNRFTTVMFYHSKLAVASFGMFRRQRDVGV